MRNAIMELIERKMESDNWTAYSPDSYFGYLCALTDDEVIEYLRERGLIPKAEASES